MQLKIFSRSISLQDEILKNENNNIDDPKFKMFRKDIKDNSYIVMSQEIQDNPLPKKDEISKKS